jgi:hypothetical protein
MARTRLQRDFSNREAVNDADSTTTAGVAVLYPFNAAGTAGRNQARWIRLQDTLTRRWSNVSSPTSWFLSAISWHRMQ